MDGRRPTYDELQQRAAELEARNAELERQVARLTAQVESLLKRLEEQRRSGKRQAGPFSKGPPKADPKPPGRKPGDGYGQHHRRAIPAPATDELRRAVPAQCPHCGGTQLAEEVIHSQ